MVYVDPIRDWPVVPGWPYGYLSLLYADTPQELHEFAQRLGLARRACSDFTRPEDRLLHYDLSPNKRKQALRLGAVEVGHAHKRHYYS